MNCLDNYINSQHLHSEAAAILFYKGQKSFQNTVSFKDLTNLIISAQHYLRSINFERGDNLIIFEQPTAGLYAFILATLGLGGSIMLIEPWMKVSSINMIIRKHKPKALMTSQIGYLLLARSKEVRSIKRIFSSKVLKKYSNPKGSITVEPMSADDNAILTFTSGTSGLPKGVHRKHQFLIDQSDVLKKYLPYQHCDKLDLTIFTNLTLINLTLGKGSLIIPNRWDYRTLKSLDSLPEKYTVDTVACGPEFLKRLLDWTETLSLDAFHLGGALCDNDLYHRAMTRWPNAKFHHVYGSTEAEPVCISELKHAVKISRKHGYYQTLYLGDTIDEIDLNLESGIAWVSGKHVSDLYEGDDYANAICKKIDEDGRVWHNMGDRIIKREEGYFYQGRDFQTPDEFETEQTVYALLKSSQSFLKSINNKLVLLGENIEDKKKLITQHFPQIDDVITRKIIRDIRHRSRIDRDASFYKGVPMKNILIFAKERVPIIANAILAIGLFLSVQYTFIANPNWIETVLILFSLILFMTELRLMDELKDYEKDKIAHSQRPLPRGLVTTYQVQLLVRVTFALLIFATMLSFVFINNKSAIALTTTIFWLYLMYKEFFIPNIINKSPILYAISHQIIILPTCLYVILALSPTVHLLESNVIAFCLIVLGSFFAFEVGRKMDPNAHPILGTYLMHYKKKMTHALILVLSTLPVLGAYLLDSTLWVFIPYLLLIITQIRVYRDQTLFKHLEGIISLILIYNLYFLAIKGMIS